jgi:hypothetical protein
MNWDRVVEQTFAIYVMERRFYEGSFPPWTSIIPSGGIVARCTRHHRWGGDDFDVSRQ